MTLKEAILSRHSVRAFTEKEIENEVVEQLNDYVAQCSKESGLLITLVVNEPNAYAKSKMASYGKFANVRNYICIVGDKNEDEKVGYWGEKIVLMAQMLGLNSCWCGLTYNKNYTLCDIPKGKKLHVVIALGYGQTQGVQSKNKHIKQIAPNYDVAPDWFRSGADAALLAPTAVNQQKFSFEWIEGDKVRAKSGFSLVGYVKIDLGIAKLHFEIGAEHKVEWA